MKDDEQRFIERMRQVLDQDVAGLDSETRARLARARAHALAASPRHARCQWSVGGALVASLLAVLVWRDQPQPPAGRGLEPVDLELLTAREDLQLLEDLEFYQWLAQERARAG